MAKEISEKKMIEQELSYKRTLKEKLEYLCLELQERENALFDVLKEYKFSKKTVAKRTEIFEIIFRQHISAVIYLDKLGRLIENMKGK